MTIQTGKTVPTYRAAVSIPILRDPRITLKARFLYSLIVTYTGPEPEPMPTNEELAQVIGCNPQLVSRYKAELRRIGLLEYSRQPRTDGGKGHSFKVSITETPNFPQS